MSTQRLEYVSGLMIDSVQTNLVLATVSKPYLLTGLSWNGWIQREGSENGKVNWCIGIVREGVPIGTLTDPNTPTTLYKPEDHIWAFGSEHNMVTAPGPGVVKIEGQAEGSFMLQTGDSLFMSFHPINNVQIGCTVAWQEDNN